MGGNTWILYVTDGSEQERVVPLSSMRALTIGRSGSSGLQLKAPGVSRNHALLDWHLDRPFLTDRGSTNGTRVGKDIVSAPRELRSGDTIHLADAKLRIVSLDVADPHTATTPVVSVPRASDLPVKRDSKGILPTHSGDRAPSTVTPWRQRSKALILGAGALAAAVLGVVTLWDRFFPQDPADVAKIESVHLIRQTTLADFASVGLRQDLSLRPAATAGDGSSGFETHALARVRSESTLSTSQMPAQTTYSPATTPTTPTTTSSSTPSGTANTPSKSPTDETSSPEQNPSPDETSSTPPVSPSDTGTSPPRPRRLELTPPVSPSDRGASPPRPPRLELEELSKLNTQVPDSHSAAICEQVELADFDTRVCDFVSRHTSETVDDKGDLLPPPEVATELARALSGVEVSESEQGKDPVGWTLAVRLDLEGLASTPMLLTWSLDGLDVLETWRAENLAYRVTATTPHDAGIAEIWIPDLARPGTYNVNVKLSFASDGMIADMKQLEVGND